MMVIGGMKLKLGRMNYGLAADNVTGQLQFRFVAMATAFRPIGDTTGSCNKEAGHLLVDHYLTVRTPAETFSKFRASLNLISNRLGIPTIPRIPRNLKNLDATVGKGGGESKLLLNLIIFKAFESASQIFEILLNWLRQNRVESSRIQ